MLERICAITGKKFIITESDLKFYKKMGVITDSDMRGLPTLCPEERYRRRIAFQNMRKLYHRTCDATGKKIISNISPNKTDTVYINPYWWSDNWNALDYGRDFDFSKTFFDNFKPLLQEIPKPNLMASYQSLENSDFVNFAGDCKNCYLIFHANFAEDCIYGFGIKKCRDVVDSINIFNTEQAYESIDLRKCYNIKFSHHCENCTDSWFLENCMGCSYCFGCSNIRQKQYYIFNVFVGKERYNKFLRSLNSGSYKSWKMILKKVQSFRLQQAHPHLHGHQNQNCSGENIFNSENTHESFDIHESRDMKFCQRIFNGPNSDCYDVSQYGMRISEVYESSVIGTDVQKCLFSAKIRRQCYETHYSYLCYFSQNIFGCAGMTHAKYCILNKQYSEKDFFIMKQKIISHMKDTGEWGEFFPMEMSPFGYNETIAQERFPITEITAKQNNIPWYKEDISSRYSGPKYKIPDDIKDVPDEILNKILTCEVSGKNYRIIKQELEFYRKMSLPIPRICPDERYKARMKLRNPRKLWKRNCDNCSVEIETTFAPERPEKVFCEACYLEEVL